MSTSELHAPVTAAGLAEVLDLRLPLDRPRRGRLVAARLRRTTIGYALLFAVGLLPVLLDASPAWKSFGLGLIAPGGGLVHAGAWIALVVTILLFVVANVAWFGAGMIVAPPAVWLGAAVYGAVRVETGNTWAEVAVPVAAALVGLVGSATVRAGHAAARKRGAARNEYLQAVEVRIDENVGRIDELSSEQLGHLRGLIDLAMQPLDSFEGFDIVDQFQTSAIRYQINFSHYALALAQANHTPAFRGYVRTAQQQLIEKMLVKRVWRYWQLENAWGNFSLDPEPIVRDNIMLSGYYGVMIGAYEAVNGDHRYDEPGSLTFQWNDKRSFAHDHHSIAEAVRRNFEASPWGMFPCEPNWIYSACNTFGMNTLLGHDALHSTAMAPPVMDKYLASLNEEFLTLDGRTTAIRSSRLGLTIPSLTSTMADAGMVLFNNPIDPAYSRRLWEIIRHEFLRIDGDGHIEMEMRGWDKMDTGNYRPSNITPLAIVGAAAAEMGDTEVADAIARTMADLYPPTETDGVRWYQSVSTQANAMHTVRSVQRQDGFRELVLNQVSSGDGPILDEVPYPDCLVARATHERSRLDAILRAANPESETTIAFAQLLPAKRYQLDVDGRTQTITADADGRATATITVGGRSILALTA